MGFKRKRRGFKRKRFFKHKRRFRRRGTKLTRYDGVVYAKCITLAEL